MLIFSGKRALFDRLVVLQGSDARLLDVQLAYTYPGEPDEKLVYGRSGRFARSPATAEYTAMQHDEALLDLVISVYVEGDDGRAGEVICENIANAIGEDLAINPQAAGGLTWTGVTAGEVSYVYVGNPDPSVTTNLALTVECEGHVS